MNFAVHPQHLQPGGCAWVEWHVDVPEGESIHTYLEWHTDNDTGGVDIDGFGVPPIGGHELCPRGTTGVFLEVGDQAIGPIDVFMEGRSEPSEPESTTTTAAPPQAATTTQPANCFDPNSPSVFLSDLAVTDLFIGTMANSNLSNKHAATPNAEIWVRVTNNGHYTCNSVHFTWLECWVSPEGTDGYLWGRLENLPIMMLDLAPGETMEIPTGIGVDLTDTLFAAYATNCFLRHPYEDRVRSNDFHDERLPVP